MSYSSGPAPTAAFLAESRVSEYLTGCIVPLVIASIFVLARIYSRAIILKVWGIDDTFITISWIGSIVLTILDCEVARYGAGRHIQTLTLADVVPQDILAYVIRLVYQLVLSGTKIGICFFYLRVFTARKSRYVIYGLMAYIVLFTIPLLLVHIFQCTPVSDFWSLSDPNCTVNELNVVYATGVCNIVGDVLLIVFAIPKIWGLKMPRKQKFALMAIMSTSLLVIVAAIVRTQLVASLANSSDPSWDDVVIALWSVIEVNTGIFCVAIVAIKPLVRQVFPSLLSSNGHSSNTRTARANTATYARGTKIHDRSQAFELQSAQDHDTKFGVVAAGTNKFWTGRGTPHGDGESEVNVLHHPGQIDVVRTVEVSVDTMEGRDTFLDADRSSDGSMKRYQHV